jgi:ribosome maturation factor RimP
MANKKGGIAAAVRAMAEPLCEELGYELWDVEYVREGADYYLRITLDSEQGITLDDCERFSRAIDPVLDREDPIPDAYHLEVSSPGIERELKTPAHIAACVGWNVEAKLFTPINGARVILGELQGMDEEKCVHILPHGEEQALVIPASAISRLCTVYDFSSGN